MELIKQVAFRPNYQSHRKQTLSSKSRIQPIIASITLILGTVWRDHLYLNIMCRCCGSDRRNNLRVSVSEWLTRDYPSTFFLVYIFKCVITLCIWIMIIISVFLLCTCITVSDFIFLRTRVYHVDRRDFRYCRGCVAKILLHMSLTTRRCHAASATSFLVQMAILLHLLISIVNFFYSA